MNTLFRNLRRFRSLSFARALRLLPATVMAAGAPTFASGDAHAAPPYVERRLVLPANVLSFDGALAAARYDYGIGVDGTGGGANVEIGYGFINRYEVGFALGMRFGTDGQLSAADEYAKLVDFRTFGRDGDRGFSPELRFKTTLVELPVFELGLEARAGLSVSDSPPQGIGEGVTRPSVRGGVPIAFHIANLVRLDSGAFVRVVFADEARSGVLFPLDAWVQATPRLFVGPRTGILLRNPAGESDIQLGAGVGYQVATSVDLKAGLLFPAINDTMSNFGLGAGVQLRAE